MIVRRSLLVLLGLLLAPSVASAAYECFQIPNAVTVAFAPQAHVFAQDTQILADAARGNGVQWAPGACLVTQRGAGANMSVDVAACTVVSEGATASVTSGNVVVAAADSTFPRIDIISATNAGVKTITAGTPSVSPLPPTIPQSGGANNLVLAFVYVPATDTAINTNQITDKRACVNAPGGGGGAGTGLSYITKVAEGTLSNEFALGSLATGLLVNTVTTGVPTVLAPTDDNIPVGSGAAWQLKALPTCSGATDALAYNISTNTFSCNTIATAGTGLSYITKSAEAGLSAEFSLGSLTTGLLLNTVSAGTGTPSTYGGAACTNQFIEDLSAIGAPTCVTSTLAGPQHANQGTTTTVLHGNAAGNPAWAGVAIADHTATGTPSATTFLRGDNTWATPAGSGTVTTSGSPAAAQVAVFTGGTAITGDTGLTYDTATNALTIAAGQLSVSGSTSPPAKIEESSSATTGGRVATEMAAVTSGNMADTFGPYISFTIKDNAAVLNNIGSLGVERAGADNTGQFSLYTYTAGVIGERLRAGSAGVTIPSLASAGTQCVQASSAGLLSVTGSACGAGGGGAVDVQTFSASGTWTKPTATVSYVFACGGGGGGGGGSGAAAGSVRAGGGGGGGGYCKGVRYQTSALGGTETVTIGAAGTGGASGADGGAGGTTTFGTKMTLPGGGGGAGHGAGGAGGSGAGCTGAGPSSTTNSASIGGACLGVAGGAVANSQDGNIGAGGTNAATSGASGNNASFGGASGASSSTTGVVTATAGGSSLFSGAGGGNGAGVNASNPGTAQAGGDGGISGLQATGAGGGGAGGTVAACGSGGNGTAGAAAGAEYAGAGGGGGASINNATGCTGGVGGGGSGGGGGGGGTSTGGAGGDGGAGWVIVISW